MKTVEIVGLPTSSTLSGPENVYLRTPAEFVATVDPRIPGEVAFVSGAQRVTVPVNTVTGEARAQLSFTEQPAGPIRAIFTPSDPRYATAVSELPITVERLATEMTLSVPENTDANTRTTISATLPADARGTVVFRGGGQERAVDVRDGRASTSLTFTEVGRREVEAVFTPSATSPYASATASASILVEESTDTTLILNGLDAPGYVAEPLTLEAVVNPAEGTENPQGRVEFVAGSQTRIVDVVGGRATAEFSFGRAGDVPVSATFHPVGSGQNRAEDSGTLQIVDAAATDSQLVGPTQTRPGTATSYRIVVTPAGSEGTADVRIDGRVVATDVEIVDGEGVLDLTFPPAVATDRQVTVDFTPADPRVHRPHSSVHTIGVEAAAVDEDALSLTVTGPEDTVETGRATAFRVSVTPDDELASPDVLNGYLTVTNNGELVPDADGEPVRIAVTRGIADVDITWTSSYPQSKFLQFTYHSADGTERASGSMTVTVVGEGGGADRVTVAPGDDDDNTGGGSLDLGSLAGPGSLSGSLGG